MRAETQPGGMSQSTFLLELGSTSLKLHFRLEGDLQDREVKAPWSIGHEVFQSGRISRDSIGGAVSTVDLMLSWIGAHRERQTLNAIATGAFRHAENIGDLVETLREKTSLDLRIITGEEEALILARQLKRTGTRAPAFAFDLGGGSLQWVSLESPDRWRYGSICVGAIRILRAALDPSGAFVPSVAECLVEKELSLLGGIKADQVVGTGGTVKGITRVLGATCMSSCSIEALEVMVQKEGPPRTLMPHRRPIFLPGVLVILRLMKTLGASELRYQNLSVGRALLETLIPEHKKAPFNACRDEFVEHIPDALSPGGWMSDSRVDPLTRVGG